tara:strand:- start:295 stop:585 length:291 start_codon:yes stop_codon:yes gene_type:complete
LQLVCFRSFSADGESDAENRTKGFGSGEQSSVLEIKSLGVCIRTEVAVSDYASGCNGLTVVASKMSRQLEASASIVGSSSWCAEMDDFIFSSELKM